MNRETMTIPTPKAIDGDAVLVNLHGPKKTERGRVVDDPRYVHSKHGAGWWYRVRFEDGGSLDVSDNSLERVTP